MPVLSLCRNLKQELIFQQVHDLVTRNISVFFIKRVTLPNSIDIYKRIFLHVIPSCIIVPCFIGLVERFNQKK